ncbi:MAG: class I SAM-dependent methyltransferase [Thermoanaerobaculia bacterium]
MSFYGEDLAFIHDRGFRQSVEAAPDLLAILVRAGIAGGAVIDLGCGSGLWAKELVRAGYRVSGIDISPAMIRIAKKEVPEAKFVAGSLFDARLGECDAVTALGEVIGYIAEARSRRGMLRTFFRRVHDALRPGGLFLFDVIVTPGKPMNYRYWTGGDEWVVLVEVHEDVEARLLTRRIITFRRRGAGYRRSEEIHLVRLFERERIEELLRDAGFSVRATRRWGRFTLPPRRLGFQARHT